jgi:sulfofructose kinase
MPGLKRVLCFGIVALDRIYEVEALPKGDAKHTATSYRESGGGIAGTAAVAVAALGARAAYLGAIGDDAAGHWLEAEMRALGVDLDLLQRLPAARTPNACALVARGGRRCLIVDRGTVQPALADAKTACADADALLVDHRFPEIAAALLTVAPREIPRVLDAEGGTREALRHLVALAEFPILSRNGLQICTGQDDAFAGLSCVRAPEARCVAVTLGEAGSLWRINGQMHNVPAPRVTASDTTGCGDVFHGAVALALAEGRTPLDAARFGTAAAALKARNGEGWRGMPKREAVEMLLTEGW